MAPGSKFASCMLFGVTILSCGEWRHDRWGALALGCLPNIYPIKNREALVKDTSKLRTYTLCPNTVFPIGSLDYNYKIIRGTGQTMIPLRPNLYIKCGLNGNHHNSCVLNGGDVQVDGTTFLENTSTTVQNVLIEGLTFVNAQRYMVWITKPGNVTFRDCVFQGSRNATSPVLLDYFDPLNYGETLTVSFENCTFNDNLYGGQHLQHSALYTRPDSQPAVIVSNSRQNRLVIQSSIFSNNNMVINNTQANIDSTLIEASGPLAMVNNCFLYNQIGVAAVTAYDSEAIFAKNYQASSSGRVCPFAQHYESFIQYENANPKCLQYDSSTCLA